MECPVHGEGCPGCIEQYDDEYLPLDDEEEEEDEPWA